MTIGKEFSETILIIADKLGVTAEYVFNIFAEAQLYKGIFSIIFILLSIIISLLLGCILFRSIYKHSESDDDKYAAGIISIIITIILYWGIHYLMSIISTACMRIYCPEYMAMQDIISLITG